jgi:hypothetical protein
MVTRTECQRSASLHYQTKLLERLTPSPAFLVKGLATTTGATRLGGPKLTIAFAPRAFRPKMAYIANQQAFYQQSATPDVGLHDDFRET